MCLPGERGEPGEVDRVDGGLQLLSSHTRTARRDAGHRGALGACGTLVYFTRPSALAEFMYSAARSFRNLGIWS